MLTKNEDGDVIQVDGGGCDYYHCENSADECYMRVLTSCDSEGMLNDWSLNFCSIVCLDVFVQESSFPIKPKNLRDISIYEPDI